MLTPLSVGSFDVKVGWRQTSIGRGSGVFTGSLENGAVLVSILALDMKGNLEESSKQMYLYEMWRTRKRYVSSLWWRAGRTFCGQVYRLWRGATSLIPDRSSSMPYLGLNGQPPFLGILREALRKAPLFEWCSQDRILAGDVSRGWRNIFWVASVKAGSVPANL